MSLFPSTETNYLAFNEKVKPFQDPYVRQAISLAINRDAIIKAVLFGNGTPANSLFPPQVPYYDPNTPGYQYNLTAAKAAMAKSTVPHGFTTTILIPAGNSDYATIATILQAELKPLNIKVNVQTARPQHGQRELPDSEVRHEPDAVDDGHPGPGRAGDLRA